MSNSRTFEIPLTLKQWKTIRDLIKGDIELSGEQAITLANTMNLIDDKLDRMKEIDEKSKLRIVRFYDYYGRGV